MGSGCLSVAVPKRRWNPSLSNVSRAGVDYLSRNAVAKARSWVFGPLIALYAKVNRAVGGKLAQILGASLVAVVAFYVSKWTGLLAYGAPAADAPPADLAGLKDAAVEAVESVTAAVNGGEDDEFA